eukprot:175984_1
MVALLNCTKLFLLPGTYDDTHLMTPSLFTLGSTFILCLFHMSTALKVIVNPSSSTVTCGTNDNCTVICNATRSCYKKTFYFYNNSIDIHCSAESACRAAKIFTSNVQSLTAVMTGFASFNSGQLYTSTTDNDIHFQCGGSSSNQQACIWASFHYMNQGQTTHHCEEGYCNCGASMIHAISDVALVCGGSSSCYRASFVLPSDEQQNEQSSLIVYTGYSPTSAT